MLQEEASHSQSENPSLQKQSLQSYNTYVINYLENDNSRKSQFFGPPTCLFSKIASKEKSDFEKRVEGIPLHDDQSQISLVDLYEHIKPPLCL